MPSIWLIPLLACVVALSPADLDSIGQSLSSNWGEGGTVRALRVRCQFELNVEQKDEALADRYFPGFTPQFVGSVRSTRPAGNPLTSWIEDVATCGSKYRNDNELFRPDGLKADRGWKYQKFFNGTNSWSYEPLNANAIQYSGSSRFTQLRLGYYQDMVGFPGNPLGVDRKTAGESGEPYRLDRLIPSGNYQIVGEEVIDGLPCVILARRGLDKLWLAHDRGWAIVRREWRWSIDGPLKRRFVHRDFREIAPGVWIPYAASMEIFGTPATRAGQRVATLKAKVLEAEANVPDDWFEPHFPKGTTVEERETGNRYPFGMELNSLDKAVAESAGYGPAFQPLPWWRRQWTLRVGFLVLLAGAAWGVRGWLARRREEDR